MYCHYMVNSEKPMSYEMFLKSYELRQPQIIDTSTCMIKTEQKIKDESFTKNDIMLRFEAKRKKYGKEKKNGETF